MIYFSAIYSMNDKTLTGNQNEFNLTCKTEAQA